MSVAPVAHKRYTFVGTEEPNPDTRSCVTWASIRPEHEAIDRAINHIAICMAHDTLVLNKRPLGGGWLG